MAHSEELRHAARRLFLIHRTPDEIANELQLARSTVYAWISRYNWAEQLSEFGLMESIERRVQCLLLVDDKTPAQLKELDLLMERHVKLMVSRARSEASTQAAAAKQLDSGGADTAGAPRSGRRKKEKPVKNDVSKLTEEDLAKWLDMLYPFQRVMHDNIHQRIRNTLKSRQIGWTYYCSGEALCRAISDGADHIFLSASRAQAEVFRSYIIKIAQQLWDIELSGNPLVLHTAKGKATLRFLGTNANTAQSYSGHLYVDEYFWMRDFAKIKTVSSAIATHKRWTLTYFSTPSSEEHPAYGFWTGDEWKGTDSKRQATPFPKFDELRDGGRLCPDGQWRLVVTMEDAVAMGFDLVDIDQLRDERSDHEWQNLFCCKFVSSADAIFPLNKVMRCMTDAGLWTDVEWGAANPYAMRPVWLGYDPSRTTDPASLVAIAPADDFKQPHRLLERVRLKGMSARYQAEQIIKMCGKYNVTHIGIDRTGIGHDVYDLVYEKFPGITQGFHYSVETKNTLVQKMLDVLDNKRLLWDADYKDIALSFLAIRRVVTRSGNGMTFAANRTKETGHADDFFAIAHALAKEPLNCGSERKSTWNLY
ncbi:terminase large subunit domain-containing protein [Ferrimonas senticii]|uniref:terminase large subunit domain-containing protein n=1 Tax=Ferrimonas senticii TaxID=394566 RepID=UPI0004039771|nr:terminase family protein [Ferrimonas senticii]